ncbi:MAG: hypothetical protein V4724_31055 [Pseudomonadota bacterium]
MTSSLLLKLKRARRSGRALLLAVALGAAAASASALPLMDWRAEDLLPMAADLKQALHLNANQQTLWQQSESRSRQLLRERQARRERLQSASGAALAGKDVELRELAGGIEAEAALAMNEEKQLREWWLTVNDALDETQRKQVAVFLAEQMQRVADGAGRAGAPRKEEGTEGGRHHKGGMGGAGAPGGGRGG